MKLCSILIASFALWAGGPFAQAAAPAFAGRPVLWSVHFDAERLRSGAGQELFADLDPILTSLSGDKSSAPGGKLESLALCGFQPQPGGSDPFPFLADLRFSSEGGGISPRFEAVSKKHGVPIEDTAGYPTMHFQHEGKEVWIAKCNDSRVLVGTSQGLLQWALTSDEGGFAAAMPPRPNEMLGGKVEIQSLLAGNPVLRNSELLKMLPHLEFHILSEGAQLDLDASAELDSERSARRAARMIDGMVSALALRDPNGPPWDERLALKQDGPRLAMKLHLEPQEAKKLFDSFAREIENGTKSAKTGK